MPKGFFNQLSKFGGKSGIVSTLTEGDSLKISKSMFLNMIKSSNPLVTTPLELACKKARKIKAMIAKVVGQNDINPDTAIKCLIREAVGAKSSCDVLRLWKEQETRPSFVTDELLSTINSGIAIVKQSVDKLTRIVNITPDELASTICNTCKLCG